MDGGFEALVQQYLQELKEAFPRWWSYWVAVKTDPKDGETLERFHREIHRLKGSAGSYGFPELSQRAAELEERLEALLQALPAQGRGRGRGEELITEAAWEQVSALLAKLELGFLAAVRRREPESPTALRLRLQLPQGKAKRPIGVLCVDDDPAWLQLLRYHLEQGGFEVRTLTDPTRTLALLSEFRPRFLVLDLDMPQLSGLELCRRVRADRSFDELVIVILTAREDVAAEAECLRIGANEFCRKTLGPTALITRLILYTNPVRYPPTASPSDR